MTSLDRSTDPCVDFYKFACGSWQTKNPIPPDQARWSVYAKLSDENEQLLWGLLEQAARPDAGPLTVGAEDRRLLRVLHGRGEGRRGRGGAACSPSSKAIDALDVEDRAGRLHGPRSSCRSATMASGSASDRIRISPTRHASSRSRTPAALACRTATTTPRPTPIDGAPRANTSRTLPGCSDCSASRPIEPPPTRARSWRSRPRSRKASLTNVAKRDPYKLLHKMDRTGLDELTPAFKWGDFLAAQGVPMSTPST